MQGEELDDQTQKTLDFINEIETEERKTKEIDRGIKSGLKVMNFGDLHRESEAKKNILSMPSLESVLNQVNFELPSLPDGLEEAMLTCQQTKELILQSYKKELSNYFQEE